MAARVWTSCKLLALVVIGLALSAGTGAAKGGGVRGGFRGGFAPGFHRGGTLAFHAGFRHGFRGGFDRRFPGDIRRAFFPFHGGFREPFPGDIRRAFFPFRGFGRFGRRDFERFGFFDGFGRFARFGRGFDRFGFGGFGFGWGGFGFGYPGYGFFDPYLYGWGYPPAGAGSVGASDVVPVTVRAPDGAEVWFGDDKTPKKGPVAVFRAKAPGGDEVGSSVIRARWKENGKTVERKQRLEYRAGDQPSLMFLSARR